MTAPGWKLADPRDMAKPGPNSARIKLKAMLKCNKVYAGAYIA